MADPTTPFLIQILLFYAKWWYISIPVSFITFFFVIFIFAFLKNRGKIACLYFDTDKSCNMVYKKVEPTGTIKIDEKRFIVARSRSAMYNKRIRFFPLYLLKHDSTRPIDIVKTAEEQMQDQEGEEEKLLPTTLNDFLNMTTLKALLSISTDDKKGLIMFIFIGFIIGFLLSFVLISMDIIKLKNGGG